MLKIAAKAFEATDFLKVLRFLKLIFLLKKTCIQNTYIFKTQHIFKTPSNRFKECFAKIGKSYNCYSKALYIRSLIGFWIQQSLNKNSLTCKVTLRYVLYETYSEPCLLINSKIFRHNHILFRHIQLYWGKFRTLRNSCIFRNLPYSESWHI